MVSFLKKLPRGKRVALYTLGSQLRMVQGFTDDTDTLIAAAEQLSTRPHPVYTNNRELSATIGELAESGLKKNPRAYVAMVRFLNDDYQGKLEMRSHDTLDALTQVSARSGSGTGSQESDLDLRRLPIRFVIQW